ncbi:MAG: DNA cytosine methyltransferase [Chloroflexi bacterium]|nr:DNA cytosine methyltransferase [Chloroflexota bacterium]
MSNQTQNLADLFCGAGGTSTGALQAAKELGIDVRLVAVNHWDIAIATHSKNHPKVAHYNSDLKDIDPRQVVPSGKLRLLLASPECTHFSNARGGAPMSKQSRASIKYVIRWASALDVQDILIENVPEFEDWGPLHRKCTCGAGESIKVKHKKPCKYGLPIQNRKGEYFYRFVRKMEKLGYNVKWRRLVAADYGDPTTRKRLFIICRKGKPVDFPEPTHHPNGGNMFAAYRRWKPARDIIDWKIKGESIFNRKKPLAENTLRRIFAGLQKYGGKSFMLSQQSGGAPRGVDQPVSTITGAGKIQFIEPYIVEYHNGKQSERRIRSVDSPLPTLDTSNRFGLAQPFIIQMDQGGAIHSIDKPMPTVTSADSWALAQPFLLTTNWTATNRSQPRSVDDPMPTIIGKDTIGLVEPFLVEYYGSGGAYSVDEPLKTQTGKDRFGLVSPITLRDQDGIIYALDIRFRMLQPHELARAMSFPKSYKFQGTREQIVKQIGNAVPVKLSYSLCKHLLGEK